jgi:tetratricopeptide (TPR) repeat protein
MNEDTLQPVNDQTLHSISEEITEYDESNVLETEPDTYEQNLEDYIESSYDEYQEEQHYDIENEQNYYVDEIENNQESTEECTEYEENYEEDASENYEDVSENYEEDVSENLDEYLQLASDQKEVGNQFFLEGNIGRSVASYKECINTINALVRIIDVSEMKITAATVQKIHSLKVSAKVNLALALFKQGDLFRALDHVNDALEIDDTHARAFYIRAKIYLLMGNYVRARKDASRVIKIVPDNSEAQYLKSDIEAMLLLGA